MEGVEEESVECKRDDIAIRGDFDVWPPIRKSVIAVAPGAFSSIPGF